MDTRRSGTPILLDSSIHSVPTVLERISPDQWPAAVLGANDESIKAAEKDLQAMLARCPSLLPFQHFSSVFHPSVCIGREVVTGVGPIDCLFVSGQGRISVVETKLYKNPEARRTVVAQLLDYCDQISRFTFDQFDDSARKFAETRFPDYVYSGLKAFVGWSLKREQTSSDDSDEEQDVEWVLDEQQFYNQLTRSLHRGEILGLIVGDHIDKRTISLAEFAKSKPGLALELGVVELAFYRPHGQSVPLMVVPTVLEYAVPVSRTVVDVRVDAHGAVSINVEPVSETGSTISGARPPQLASNLEFLDMVNVYVPAANNAMTIVLSKMQQIADDSEGSIELDYFTATANLYWQFTDGRRRFFALRANKSTATATARVVLLNKVGYEEIDAHIKEVTYHMFPKLYGKEWITINVLDVEAISLCTLVEKLSVLLHAQAENN